MSSVHRYIDEQAVSRVQNPSFNRFLQQHLSEIQTADINQDIHNNGIHHFLKLKPEIKGAYLNEYSVQLVALKPNQVLDRYTSGYKKSLRHWQLTEDHLPQGKNLYQEILDSFRLIVNAINKEDTNAQIQQIGRLAHAVGDAFQPLHLTPQTNWSISLQAPERQVHFLTDAVFSKLAPPPKPGQRKPYELTEAGKFRLMAEGKPEPLTLTLETLKPYLLRSFQDTYMKLFPIVEIHRQLLSQPNQDTAALEAKFNTQIQDIYANRIQAAQQAFTALLDLAWRTAKT
ncbi:MAG: hypothetical protein KTR14_06025 [Vampirovibrio sp.]|nr:hypothetical protein [Vampirovibrio sp.]